MLPSVSMFVQCAHHCTSIYWLSCRNSRARPNDRTMHSVATVHWGRPPPHRHCTVCPGRLFPQNPVFRTEITIEFGPSWSYSFFSHFINPEFVLTWICCRLALTNEHACLSSSKAHFRWVNFSGWIMSITQATSNRGRPFCTAPDNSLMLDMLSVCRTKLSSEMRRIIWNFSTNA